MENTIYDFAAIPGLELGLQTKKSNVKHAIDVEMFIHFRSHHDNIKHICRQMWTLLKDVYNLLNLSIEIVKRET